MQLVRLRSPDPYALSMHTSLKGLFVAGDLRIEAPKQVVSAAGDGSIALQVISYLQELA